MAILKIRDENGKVHEIASLKGERGEKGEKGDTGAQGEQGIQGVQGEKGDKGDTGEVTYAYAHRNLANALKGTVTGNPVAIKDPSPLEHEVSVRIDRKNLLPDIKEQTVDGMVLSKASDGGYVVNGTFTTGTEFNFGTIVLSPGTYTLRANNAACGNAYLYVISDNDVTVGTRMSLQFANAQETITLSGYETLSYRITFETADDSGGTVENFTFNPVLVEGGETLPVHKYGKNLLDLSNSTNGFTRCAINQDGTITSTLTNSGYCQISIRYLNDLLLAHKGKPITFSVNKGNESTGTAIVVYDKSDGVISATESYTNTVAVTIPEEVTEIGRVGLRFNRGASEADYGAVLSDFQLELGETATAYEPYLPPTDVSAVDITANGKGMTLFADNGATITAEYNRDLNKVIAAIEEALR